MKNLRIILPFCLIIFSSLWLLSCGESDKSEINISAQPKATPTIILNQKDKSSEAQSQVASKKVEPSNIAQVAEETDNFDYEKAAVNISLDDLLKRISERNNKPLFLNFWAIWCIPCIQEFPHIVELQKEYGDKIDFIVASCDKLAGSNDKVPQVMKELKVQFETFILQEEDQKKINSAIDDKWMGAMPFTIIYDADGKKAHQFVGGRSKEEYEEIFKEILQSE